MNIMDKINTAHDRTNGCGPYWLGEWVPDGPDGRFKCPCDKHDQRYDLGGSEFTRWHTDLVFFWDMLTRSTQLPWYKMPLGWVCAVLYYVLVVIFGWRSFNYTKWI